MIDESAFVIIKINDNCSTMKFSGTLIAYNYVKTKNLNKIVVLQLKALIFFCTILYNGQANS